MKPWIRAWLDFIGALASGTGVWVFLYLIHQYGLKGILHWLWVGGGK